ncbi:MAG: enoyl-ACP reductase [Acidobacteria bacterium]|nr:enoyl-ACP reductase [Acidobacteriota bacterium]
MKLLEGRKGVIFGVANKRSIAWACAKALSDAGMQLAFTYQGDRLRESVEKLVTELPGESPVYPCDVTSDDEIERVFDQLGSDFGSLDMLLHSVAFAKKEELEKGLVYSSREGFLEAQNISAYSLVALARGAMPLLEKSDNGSVLTMTYYGAEKVARGYNLMGVAKASLEACVRYLASDLGEKGIRVNAISAGPVNTLAARGGIRGFTKMLAHHAEQAPLRRNIEVEEVANAALFLASGLGSGVTGEVLHVDCGFNIIAI